MVRRKVSLDAEIDAEIGRQPEGLNGDLMHDICIKLLSRQRPELRSILWNRRWGYSRRLKRLERTAFVRKKDTTFEKPPLLILILIMTIITNYLGIICTGWPIKK